ncbi:MAG TPA: ATP-binding protein [Gemmatimonadota bacterium]|nr:ATP-binding protein [Gemmatimonadota bacterium]
MASETGMNPTGRRARRLQTAAVFLAAGVIALGALVHLGWALDHRPLKSIAPGLVAMNPLTAAAFMLAGASLWLDLARPPTAAFRTLSSACAALVVVLAILRLAGYAGLDLGLDRVLFSGRLDAETIPNRMAPNTAAAFLLSGLGLLGLLSTRARIQMGTQVLVLVVLAISMVTLCGYAYSAGTLAQVRDFIPMALHTAAGFAALAFGILCARPRAGLLADITGEESGARTARRLLPVVIGIPLILGWLRVHGERAALYDSGTGTGLMVACWVVAFGIILWWQARALNRADAKRSAAEAEIAGLNRALRQRATEIEASNRELEAFSYSVSHDLRAPLRSITSFSQALLEDHAGGLDEEGRDYLQRVVRGGQRMAELIEDMMVLSRISRREMERGPVDLSSTALEIASELARGEPERHVVVDVEPDLLVDADPKLLRILIENLLANAWKFTARQPDPRIELGVMPSDNGRRVFYVRDNGAGFDMEHAGRLFAPFQRLHSEAEFPGTGVGLATVQRVVRRHGGEVWAEARVRQGATFYFTIRGEGP